jgi:membrane protease YdiL (CAAX protease family)
VAVFGLVHATAAAQADLATGILSALLLVGLLSVVALAAFVWGVVELFGIWRDPISERTHRWAPRLGWANGLLGLASAVGAVIAVPRSADGWKLVFVAAALLALGATLLVSSRRAGPARGM